MIKTHSKSIKAVTRPKVVIVGGGFAGLEAAKGLQDAPVSITLVDKSNHHLFQPLLYQVATASLSPADIAYPIRHILARQKNVEVLLAKVTGIDAQNKRVILKEGSLEFDYLILATGASHSYFTHDEWEPFAPGLKAISDATAIRNKLLLAFEKAEAEQDPVRRANLMTFVLVGGGPTGVEMAGAIAELSHRALVKDFRHIDPRSSKVILLEAGPRVLAAFPEVLSKRAAQDLGKLGVEVRTNSRVERIDADGVWIEGNCIRSQTVIWTAGVMASPVGKWLGVEVDRAGKVKVNPDLSVPGHENIFVAGDAAHIITEKGETVPGVAPAAIQQGAYVASVIINRAEGQPARKPFKYLNKGNMATIGRSSAVADLGRLRFGGILAWLAWLLIHIYYLIGFKNRFVVIFQWFWNYITFQRGSRLIVESDRS